MKELFLSLGGSVLLIFLAWLKYRLNHFKKVVEELKEEVSVINKKEKISKDALSKKKIRDKKRNEISDAFDESNPYSGLRGAKKKD